MGSLRVRHDWKWKRKWQSTPVFLPGKSHGQRSLVGYSPWACKELDMADQLTHNGAGKVKKRKQEKQTNKTTEYFLESSEGNIGLPTP